MGWARGDGAARRLRRQASGIIDRPSWSTGEPAAWPAMREPSHPAGPWQRPGAGPTRGRRNEVDLAVAIEGRVGSPGAPMRPTLILTKPDGLEAFPRAGVTTFCDAQIPRVAVRAKTSRPEDRPGNVRSLARYPLVIPQPDGSFKPPLPRWLPIRGHPVTGRGPQGPVENNGWAGPRHPAPAGFAIKPLPKEPCPRTDRRFGSAAGTGRTGPEAVPASR
jgi:hypothetical protein